LLLTCLRFNYFKKLVSKYKIDGDSFVYSVDNLKCKDLFEEGDALENETKKDTFTRIWKSKIEEICNQNNIRTPQYKLLFGDIMNVSLWMQSDEPFTVVYADTCDNVTDKFFSWLFNEDTHNGVANDGVLAFTLMLNRGKEFKFPENVKNNSAKFAFYGAEYDDMFNMEHYEQQMNGLTHLIESTHQWEVEEMIHYCEKNRKSQMVSVICKKCK